ncbi:hypothetical protein FCM35_KLT05170 [Carex littledalei]|uniref:Uncharacterized protein n=1 Tax=Carex littledalei TaxID=544730 RepID=A0A833R5C1_9POAL|nr:hypothetical protein FCM35_KLT05170 [Carex littledalei]
MVEPRGRGVLVGNTPLVPAASDRLMLSYIIRHQLKKRKEMEGEADPSDDKEAQGKESIRSTERKVLAPLNASAGPTLTPLMPVDGESVKHGARMHSIPIAKPQGSMCSKCESVLEELKKMNNSEKVVKKKLSVKIKTISMLRNMLEEAENKAKDLTSRALSAESALRASEARAQEAETKLVETEAKLAEADARAHTTKMQLLDIDIRAQKSEVKACKFEVKLVEARGSIQKAMSDLSKAEQRAHKFEDKLMEAMKMASSAEAKLTEIEARMKESQRMACGVKVEGGAAWLMQDVAMAHGKDGKN